MTIDAHLHRTARLNDVCPGFRELTISAMPAIASHLRESALDPRTVIVGPDAELRPWVTELSALLASNSPLPTKTRLGDRSVEIALDVLDALKGCPALLVDDIVSSGGTRTTSCARAVIAAGAISVDAIVTNAGFHKELMEDFTKSGIRTVRSTTSVPHSTNAIALDRLLANALRPELIAAPQQGEVVMSITLRFCGAARTVTGSCSSVRDAAFANSRRLRAVSRPQDVEGAELWRLPVRAGWYRRCPSRPMRISITARACQARAGGFRRPYR